MTPINLPKGVVPTFWNTDLIWLPVVGHEKTHLISEEGHIYSRPRKRLLAVSINPDTGYAAFGNTGVHRLVAKTFLADPPSPEHTQVAHKDGSRTMNSWTNLRWSTATENQADRKRHGTHATTCAKDKLRPAAARFIRSEHGLSQRQLAEIFGVTIPAINHVIKRRCYKNVD